MTIHDTATSIYPVGILCDHCVHRVLKTARDLKVGAGDRRTLVAAGVHCSRRGPNDEGREIASMIGGELSRRVPRFQKLGSQGTGISGTAWSGATVIRASLPLVSFRSSGRLQVLLSVR